MSASEIPLIEEDKDLLLVLKSANNNELDTIVKYLTQKGSLGTQLDTTEKYKKYHPNHQSYVEEIAAEIQKFGGSTIANISRGGKGVFYKEVVCDVAEKQGVKYSEDEPIDFIEISIILNMMEEIWDKSENKRKKQEIIENISEKFKNKPLPSVFPSDIIYEIIRKGDKESFLVGHNISSMMSNIMSQKILGEDVSLSKTSDKVKKGLMVGIPWLINPFFGVISLLGVLSGPAYRVTIPTVIHVAAIRQSAYNDGRLSPKQFRG